jgi:hypothetical protein
VHQLQERDEGARIQYCHWFRRFVREGINVLLDNVFFSDEAWFHLNGYINSRLWSTENPHAVMESPLHPVKIGVWCAISRKQIVELLFFDETINVERYQNLLTQFIALLEENERDCWLQQDGATLHTANTTATFLQEFFGERVIGGGLWPPRSPDLTLPNFFLWGCLKDRVYRNNSRNLEELKHNIEANVTSKNEQTLRNFARNITKRVDACLHEGGGHFQHLL